MGSLDFEPLHPDFGAKVKGVSLVGETADETLEEINIRAREQWQELGGENFYSIPCLNDNAAWLADIIRNQ